jgi:hypothetical protein
MRNAKPKMAAATIDEVTADMSKDPRRERDDGDDGDEAADDRRDDEKD